MPKGVRSQIMRTMFTIETSKIAKKNQLLYSTSIPMIFNPLTIPFQYPPQVLPSYW